MVFAELQPEREKAVAEVNSFLQETWEGIESYQSLAPLVLVQQNARGGKARAYPLVLQEGPVDAERETFEAAIVGVDKKDVRVVAGKFRINIDIHHDVISDWAIEGKKECLKGDYHSYEPVDDRSIGTFLSGDAFYLMHVRRHPAKFIYYGEIQDPRSRARRRLFLLDFRDSFFSFGDVEQFNVGRWLLKNVGRKLLVAGNVRQEDRPASE